MKKNLLLLFTLLMSLIITYVAGGVVVFADGLPQVNPELTRYISRVLSNKKDKILPQQFTTDEEPTASQLAKCLTQEGFVMYGTDDCPACAIQRSYFGDYFSQIKYINCDKVPNICKDKGITGYPTWEDKDGKKYKGVIPLDTLSKLSGC